MDLYINTVNNRVNPILEGDDEFLVQVLAVDDEFTVAHEFEHEFENELE